MVRLNGFITVNGTRVPLNWSVTGTEVIAGPGVGANEVRVMVPAPATPSSDGVKSLDLSATESSGGYADLTVTELRVLLNERGLSLSGKKADMIERLENDDASDESNGEDEEVTEEEGDEVAEDGSETGSE